MTGLKLFGAVALISALCIGGACGQETLPSFAELPWVWVCRSDRGCVKVHKNETLRQGETGRSLAGCKLTCNPAANLWPIPRGSVSLSQSLVTFQLADVAFNNISAPTKEVKALMEEAIQVFRDFIQKSIASGVIGKSPAPSQQRNRPSVNVRINITSDETVLKMTTDESYTLSATTAVAKARSRNAKNSGVSTTTVDLAAKTFFGARHALETLSQIMGWDESIGAMIMISEASITDSPAFPHRGLLIDTSRNFVTVEVIKKIIDAMSYNKLNVFHWHLTDTHSFPFVSTREPRLAQYGAYSPNQVYNPEHVRDIVHYAMVRGVKVLPEFDAPAHVGSGWEWGEKFGLGELALCVNKEPWLDYCVEPPCGQLNPINDNIYPVLNNIYKDMSELFLNDIFHMGGDEVHMRCWNETEMILTWLDNQGRNGRTKEDFIHVWTHFQERALTELDKAYANKQPVILWTSGLTEDGHADRYLDKSRYIIQIWTTGSDKSISELYSQGFKLIMSNYDAWYFDCGYGAWVGDSPNNWCSPYIGWQKVYSNSPREIIANFSLPYNPDQMLGGEAALWSEQVDSASMEGKLWPRGAALAERLWSDPNTDWKAAESRLIHHRQRLVSRGILADALQPEWCHQNEGYCFL